MVDIVFVNPNEPVMVFDGRAVSVRRLVPEWVVLADMVFELETDLDTLVVPVDVFDDEALPVWVTVEEVVFELIEDKE